MSRFRVLSGICIIILIVLVARRHRTPSMPGNLLIGAHLPGLPSIGLSDTFVIQPLPALIRYAPDQTPLWVSGEGFCRVGVLQEAVLLAVSMFEAFSDPAWTDSGYWPPTRARDEGYFLAFRPTVQLTFTGSQGQVRITGGHSVCQDSPLYVRRGKVLVDSDHVLAGLTSAEPQNAVLEWNDEAVRDYIRRGNPSWLE